MLCIPLNLFNFTFALFFMKNSVLLINKFKKTAIKRFCDK
ncbi:hypothetical protein PROPEN_02721 [Proteus penneri ATCC 35198]|nr:hypothetical protein PROPEN_02721 [Proteus penneri ATCC 35198]